MAWPIHLSKWESGLKGEPGIWLAFSSGLDLASSRGASGLRGVDQVEVVRRQRALRFSGTVPMPSRIRPGLKFVFGSWKANPKHCLQVLQTVLS